MSEEKNYILRIKNTVVTYGQVTVSAKSKKEALEKFDDDDGTYVDAIDWDEFNLYDNSDGFKVTRIEVA